MRHHVEDFTTVGTGENVFIYPLDGSVTLLGSGTKDLIVHRMRVPQIVAKTSHQDMGYQHVGMMKYRPADDSVTSDKQRKGILKNSNNIHSDGRHTPSQKLDVTQIKCVLKKRKTSANEKLLSCASSLKSQKKVKFDDKLNKLAELGMKYGVENESKEHVHVGAAHSCIRQQHQIQKTSLKPKLNKSDASKVSAQISDVYDLKESTENRTPSPRSMSKSNSTNGSGHRRTSGDSFQFMDSEPEPFVHMEYHNDGFIPIYNPRIPSYQNESESTFDESALKRTSSESRLIENGIPVFTKTGKFIRTTKLKNASKPQNIQKENDIGKPEKPTYRLGESKRSKLYSVGTEQARISSAQKKIFGKSSSNTLGGTKVTRCPMKPHMFSRYSKEKVSFESDSSELHKNYCDDGKTWDIMRWLAGVKEVQVKEGFINLHIDHHVN